MDDMGNITKTTQDDGSVWEYTYDNRYRLITAVRAEEDVSPEIETKYIYTYDDADNMMTKVEPFGDDFNDGDYSGWTAYTGAFSVSSGVLPNTYSASVTSQIRKTDFESDSSVQHFSYRRDSNNTSDDMFIYFRFDDWSNYMYARFKDDGAASLTKTVPTYNGDSGELGRGALGVPSGATSIVTHSLHPSGKPKGRTLRRYGFHCGRGFHASRGMGPKACSVPRSGTR
jgi:YD repeat-containing protein